MADRPSVQRQFQIIDLNNINHLEWVAKNDSDYVEKSKV